MWTPARAGTPSYLSRVDAGHLGLDGGTGVNGLHLDHTSRVTELVNFQFRF